MANVPYENFTDWFLYINGLEVTNDSTTPNNIINVASGQCRDSTDTYVITNTASVNVTKTTSGLAGLDTGTIAASTLYAVYIVGDAVTGLTTGAMISTNMTTPLLPYGYNVFRKIGYVRTDGSSNFLKGYWSGNNNSRLFMYDAPIATSITAGAATSYTALTLATFVPAIQNTPVWIAFDMTPAAASRIMSLHPFGATGDAVSITSQVTGVHVTGNVLVQARLDSGAPKIEYKWSAGGGDAVALNVAGYQFYI